MIVVKVELWPFGSEARKKTLATMTVVNDGTGTRTSGNYKYQLFSKDGRTMSQGSVLKFARQRFHVWKLLALVMLDAYQDWLRDD